MEDVSSSSSNTTSNATASGTMEIVSKMSGRSAGDRWQPRPDWSIAPGPNEPNGDGQDKNKTSTGPLLTSQQCYDGLQRFFRDIFSDGSQQHVDDSYDNYDDGDDNDEYSSSDHGRHVRRLRRPRSSRVRYEPFTLAVITEASSHPAGLEAVYGQPWIYGGGGLGNMDECPTASDNDNDSDGGGNFQVCLAGGTGRDSLTFASVCIVQDCTAHDLLADDFVERLETASFHVHTLDRDDETKLRDREEVLQEYITLHKRVAEVGKFLGTGWVCGEYKVQWEVFPTTVYCFAVAICITLCLLATFWVPKYIRHNKLPQKQRHRQELLQRGKEGSHMSDTSSLSSSSSSPRSSSERSMTRNTTMIGSISSPPRPSSSSYCERDTETMVTLSMAIMNKFVLGRFHTNNDGSNSSRHAQHNDNDDTDGDGDNNSCNHVLPPFWSVWNVQENLKRLVTYRPETACLDGLKVGSILWIIAAHVMAIQSSTGAGYLNPKDFLPPTGITTTFIGQLLFSSRFAVDTFLCISGYLAMYVLQRKLTSSSSSSSSSSDTVGTGGATPWNILVVLILRILRILPLYVFCLGLWMFIAPHLGSGPFWYQWENFLEPCRDSWWTNLLFVNNFLPWGCGAAIMPNLTVKTTCQDDLSSTSFFSRPIPAPTFQGVLYSQPLYASHHQD